ncbi:uncharacterized protein LOC142005682 [Carettochelys insculpta]|uniref:uncharacterized protein LOC142005682 n=1 Tax=Carettochelys insculpta TaxID=44489 RepID=UPI003EB9470E
MDETPTTRNPFARQSKVVRRRDPELPAHPLGCEGSEPWSWPSSRWTQGSWEAARPLGAGGYKPAWGITTVAAIYPSCDQAPRRAGCYVRPRRPDAGLLGGAAHPAGAVRPAGRPAETARAAGGQKHHVGLQAPGGAEEKAKPHRSAETGRVRCSCQRRRAVWRGGLAGGGNAAWERPGEPRAAAGRAGAPRRGLFCWRLRAARGPCVQPPGALGLPLHPGAGRPAPLPTVGSLPGLGTPARGVTPPASALAPTLVNPARGDVGCAG